MSNVDKYKVISNRLNDELLEIDKQLFNIKQQLDEVNQQRNKKLEEISFNNLSIQNIMHHENPSLGYLSFDSIEILLSYLDKWFHENLYCANKNFRAYKLSTYYYKLTKAKSIDFYFNNNGFRDILLKSVLNPSQQISVQFVNNVHVSDTRCLANVHSLILKGCTKVKDVSSLGNIHYLDLTSSKGFRDISALTNVHTLILDDCSAKILNFRNLTNVSTIKITHNKYINDLTSLANCEDLTFIRCPNIRNISALVNAKKLHFQSIGCKAFDNLNDFKNLKVLDVCVCPDEYIPGDTKSTFQDFSNMDSISLQNCRTIEEIKNLNNVKLITIANCYNVTKINSISDANQCKIENCSGVSEIRNIYNIEDLIINELRGVNVISGVSNIGNLKLYNLFSLTTLEHLNGISKVELVGLDLSNFRFLLGNPLIKLDIYSCPSLIDISYLGFCPDVTIESCNGIIDISCLANCHRVVIKNCRGVTDVSSLGNVHDLVISYHINTFGIPNPHHLTGVSTLGNVNTLTLSGLDIIDADIATLGTVKSLHMSYCNSIVDVSPLAGLEKLTLHSMRKVVDVSMLNGIIKDLLCFDNGKPINNYGFQQLMNDGDY